MAKNECRLLEQHKCYSNDLLVKIANEPIQTSSLHRPNCHKIHWVACVWQRKNNTAQTKCSFDTIEHIHLMKPQQHRSEWAQFHKHTQWDICNTRGDWKTTIPMNETGKNRGKMITIVIWAFAFTSKPFSNRLLIPFAHWRMNSLPFICVSCPLTLSV